jgi:hypothetical protein
MAFMCNHRMWLTIKRRSCRPILPDLGLDDPQVIQPSAMLRCHRKVLVNLVGFHRFAPDWTRGCGCAPKGFVETISLDFSSSIGVLVADSNHMQCQRFVGALCRRPELQVTSCVLDPEIILHATNSCRSRSPSLTPATPETVGRT